MRFQELLGLIKEYFIFAVIGVTLLTLIFCVGYFVIYRKIMKGEKPLWSKHFIVGIMIVGYLLMVFSVTFFSRSGSMPSLVNLHLFSSYKEAWNSFTLRTWQFVILNIFMFVPLGILLPLFHKRFLSPIWTIGVGFAFTLSIEGLQLILKIGVFDLDDIFNNVLGIIIGYSVFMIIYTLVKKQSNKKLVVYILPILVIISIFSGVFIKYNHQEYGNMASAYTYKVDLRDTKVTSNIKFNKEEAVVPVYNTNTLTQGESYEFAIQLFKDREINTNEIEINRMSEDTLYKTTEYSLWMKGNTSAYWFTDFSSFDEETTTKNLSEEVVRDMLFDFGIEIPASAVFLSNDIGNYSWTVDQLVEDDEMIDGTISCDVNGEDTIESVSNDILRWHRYKAVEIISEEAAYQQLLEGKFSIWVSGGELQSIEIVDVKLDYEADTKNFYQPVYVFKVIANGDEITVSMIATKK